MQCFTVSTPRSERNRRLSALTIRPARSAVPVVLLCRVERVGSAFQLTRDFDQTVGVTGR
jgi:hypothetical protein